MPADNVYFAAPGVATVRWEPAGKLVLVESGGPLEIAYFATVDEARTWLAGNPRPAD